MSAVDNTKKGSLKFKITSTALWVVPEEENSQKNIGKPIGRNGQRDNRAINGRSEHSELRVLETQPVASNSSKRRTETPLDGPRRKRPKMDLNVKLQCKLILKELMTKDRCRVFREPVDPVKLCIPDYFSYITEPMDLGTIRDRLEGDMYSSAEAFADDVRLTFSNATTYNPRDHEVYQLAVRLNSLFSQRWKLLETKLKIENKTIKQPSSIDDMEKSGCHYVKQTVEKNCAEPKPFDLKDRVKCDSSRLVQSDEKNHLKQKPVGLSKASGQSQPAAGRPKVEPARRNPDGCSLSRNNVQKEHYGPSASAFASQRRSRDPNEGKCGLCGSFPCHCSLKSSSAQTSLSDLTSERSSEHNNYSSSDHNEVKKSSALHSRSSGEDTDGPGVVVNEESSSYLSTPAASGEGWSSFSVPLSPSKALRVAQLKNRFASTIFKATHQANLDHGDKSDPARMQHERLRLEREQLAEKARIEAEIKAAEAASQKRAQDNLKRQREREREAARMALQTMEKTVEIDGNLVSLRNLEMLCSSTGPGFGPGSPLEQFGLYMKNDYLEEDEDAILAVEEGEIPSYYENTSLTVEEGEILS